MLLYTFRNGHSLKINAAKHDEKKSIIESDQL